VRKRALALARIVSWASPPRARADGLGVALDPSRPQAGGLTMKEIGLVEINEAFARRSSRT